MTTMTQGRSILARWRSLLLWQKIFIALLLGATLGVILNMTGNSQAALSIRLVGTAFVAAISMLIVPLVFVSLVCGMTSVTDMARMGRIGVKTVAFYLGTTGFAVGLGVLLAVLIRPGVGVQFDAPTAPVPNAAPGFAETLIAIIPTNPISAAADGNVLQIIFFAIVFGLAINLAGEPARPLRDLFDALNAAIMKLTEIVISFAPYGVFALMAWVAGTYGLDVLLPLGKVIFALYLGCVIHALVIYGGLIRFLSGLNPLRYFQGVVEPVIVAFTSTSSAGSLPVTMTAVEQNLGVSRSVSSFTLPLGATINMDGTCMYQGVVAIFVAQAFGIDLSVGDYMTIVLTATLASIGTAGVPGAGLVMLSLVLTSVGLPLEGVAIIAGIDRILDMARTALNVAGDAACSVVVARSEDELDQAAYDTPHVLKSVV
ncbi:MAG: dicarboxylate/amino acid:cation symporter [Paracoccus sp. (in: a-proteobacteria)]|uniref:dicarboxylate/amino acid:cation symporter n=1 Tax=Paracoccus sp. TaxID=267 RepID=UPI0039188964